MVKRNEEGRIIPKSGIKRTLKIVYLGALFIYGIVALVLASRAYKEFVSLALDYDLMLDNWKEDVIMEIEVQNNADCSTNFTYLWTYIWPGTNSGCDCRHVTPPTQSNVNIKFLFIKYFKRKYARLLQVSIAVYVIKMNLKQIAAI